MRYDAIIIGGSFAGLSAAMYIGRARRSVCIIDTGRPRNRFAAHSHGFLTQDGREPHAILDAARSQVAAYPTVTFVEGEAMSAVKESDGFSVRLATDQTLEAAALVLAFGIADELPDIPGLAERWGKSVLHCPYCHGYEFHDQRLGVLNLSPKSVHQAVLVAEWGPTTFYLNGAGLPDESLHEMEQRGVAIEPTPIRALHGQGERLSEIELANGHTSPVDALFIGPRNHLNSDIAAELGCETEEAPLGRIIKTDSEQRTTVPNVYAAGDITRGAHNITWACADGVTAATAVHRSLVFDSPMAVK